MLPELLIARTAIAPREPDYTRIGAIYRIVSRLRNRGLGRFLSDAIKLAPPVRRVVPSALAASMKIGPCTTHWLPPEGMNMLIRPPERNAQKGSV